MLGSESEGESDGDTSDVGFAPLVMIDVETDEPKADGEWGGWSGWKVTEAARRKDFEGDKTEDRRPAFSLAFLSEIGLRLETIDSPDDILS